jgi:hypothetical protein
MCHASNSVPVVYFQPSMEYQAHAIWADCTLTTRLAYVIGTAHTTLILTMRKADVGVSCLHGGQNSTTFETTCAYVFMSTNHARIASVFEYLRAWLRTCVYACAGSISACKTSLLVLMCGFGNVWCVCVCVCVCVCACFLCM